MKKTLIIALATVATMSVAIADQLVVDPSKLVINQAQPHDPPLNDPEFKAPGHKEYEVRSNTNG